MLNIIEARSVGGTERVRVITGRAGTLLILFIQDIVSAFCPSATAATSRVGG